MRILDMATFVALARNRHFGRTAQELNATQPAISSRLSSLEEEFGCRLVRRGDREFQLTPEGERVLQGFQQVLEQLDELKNAVKDGNLGAPPLVRIGAIDSVVSTWMSHLIESLNESMPRLRVELTVEGTKDLVSDMGRGKFDLIFGIDPAIGEGFRSFVACVYQMIWAGAPKLIDESKAYAVDELAQMPIITFPKDTPPYTHIAPYFQDERVLASKMTSSNSLFAIISLLIDGFGIGAIPTVTIERELDVGLLRRVNVAKRFPPMPIICTYQTTMHQKITHHVAEHARRSASEYCVKARDGTAWTI
ncbi:MAG: LysR family transcriptional regulator [Ancalomicrobiaceae bacterium]|nr:LysR family transcriptional regulator [Ancalomicrobiaceae bacterium]